MTGYERGLSGQFIKAFNNEYDKDRWLTKLVNDKEIFTAIRKERINFYYQGNSIVNLFFSQKCLRGETHYKYLLNPRYKGKKCIDFNLNGEINNSRSLSDLMLQYINDLKALKDARVCTQIIQTML